MVRRVANVGEGVRVEQDDVGELARLDGAAAVVRGLRLDGSATRDTERVCASYEMAMALLEPVLRSSRDR